MNKVLVINSSIHGNDASSYSLLKHYLSHLSEENISVVTRDLSTSPLPHLDANEFASWMVPDEEKSESQSEASSLSETAVQELLDANLILIAVPMYNFGIPSTLKAWIDRVARAGKTFKYTENGPVGLLGGRKVVVFATRGGVYQGTALDTQSSYLKNVLAFLGLDDTEFVYAEGLAMSEHKDTSLKDAKSTIDALFTQVPA